jgi:hypothetical protein
VPAVGTGLVARDSDTAMFVGLSCQVCGKRVLLSATGQGFWAVDPKTKAVLAWHLECRKSQKVTPACDVP